MANHRHSFHLQIALGGVTRTLDLRPNSMRAAGFQLLLDDGKALRPVPSAPVATYRGEVRGASDSQVGVSVFNGQLTGQVHIGRQVWNIEPTSNVFRSAPPRQHMIYAQSAAPKWNCGAGKLASHNTGTSTNPRRRNAVINECEIVIDCDNAYYKFNGSNRARTQTAVDAILNVVDMVYRRDVEVCYKLSSLIVRTTQVYKQGPNAGCIPGPNLLSEMVTYWNTNHKAINRDIAHMFSAGQPTNNIAGCAFVGVICSQTSGYGVSKTDGAFASNVGVVMHELGHNWNLNHCADQTPCNVMCGGCLTFGPKDIKTVYAYKAGLQCLGVCGGCRNEAEYTYFGQGCKGTGSGSGPACVQSNWNQTNQGFGWGRLDFAFTANTGSQARSIESVEFYCGSGSATNIPVQIYAATATGAPGATLGTATMRVGTTDAAYKATFAAPILIPANTSFFVGLKSPKSPPFFRAPLSSGGTKIQEYWRNAGGWNKGSTNSFNYRINCTTAGARPLLTAGRPRVNATYRVRVSMAKPNAPCGVFHSLLAVSQDLTGVGAPNCRLYIDPNAVFLIQTGRTNAVGVASFGLPVPNVSAVCGVKWYEQIAINEPTANRFGWVVTRRGQPVAGN